MSDILEFNFCFLILLFPLQYFFLCLLKNTLEEIAAADLFCLRGMRVPSTALPTTARSDFRDICLEAVLPC